MTLEQLRIFVAVADRLHMTRAAEHLHLTQSAVSAAIAALENRHDVRLFHRVGRGLELSQAGALFLDAARAVLLRAEAASEVLAEAAGLKRGSIRIAASQTLASYWLPRRLARFASAYPAIAISLIVGNSGSVAEAVQGGASDLGFIEGGVGPEDLLQEDVGGDRLSLYAAPAHPLASRASVSKADLAAAVWVGRELGSGTRAELESALRRHGLDPPLLRIALELPSNEAVLDAAASGDLIAGVSDLAAHPHEAAGRLVRLEFTLAARRFTALRHKERAASAAALAFRSFL